MESLGRAHIEIASDMCCADCGAWLLSTIVLINRTKYAIKMPITINISLWGERKTIMIGHLRRFTHEMLFGNSNKKKCESLVLKCCEKQKSFSCIAAQKAKMIKLKHRRHRSSSGVGSAAREKKTLSIRARKKIYIIK